MVDDDAPEGLRQEFIDLAFHVFERIPGYDEARLHRVITQSLGFAASGHPYGVSDTRLGAILTAPIGPPGLRSHLPPLVGPSEHVSVRLPHWHHTLRAPMIRRLFASESLASKQTWGDRDREPFTRGDSESLRSSAMRKSNQPQFGLEGFTRGQPARALSAHVLGCGRSPSAVEAECFRLERGLTG